MITLSYGVPTQIKFWFGARPAKKVGDRCSMHLCPCKGTSIKYVTLFLANCDSLPLVTLRHTSRDPQKSTSHISDPPIFSRPSTKSPDKSPLYIFSLNCSRGLLSGGFCQRVFCLEGFVRGGFCPYSLLSEYICYNRKLKITLNFMFHM